MGWSAYELGNNWQLWVRHGLTGWYIQRKDSTEEIRIPRELLVNLAAQEVRSQRISELEDMDDNDVLGLSKERSVSNE